MDTKKEFPALSNLVDEFAKIDEMYKKGKHMHDLLQQIQMIMQSLLFELPKDKCEVVTLHTIRSMERRLRKELDHMWY